jgi:CxxC motif-containing protein (DUF1111 family)
MSKLKYIIAALAVYCAFWICIDLMQTQKAQFSYSVSDSPRSGGETTVFNTSREAFAKPLKNLPTVDLRNFTFGNKMFNTKWVTAPASVISLDGLGPTFNRMSCAACHFKDGRGRPPLSQGEPMKSMLVRLSIFQNGEYKTHPIYGDQLNDRAINGVDAEGRAVISYQDIHGAYPDGTTYTLRKQTYEFKNMAFGDLGNETAFSPRVAPAVHGMGLLDAIPDSTILAMADASDKNNDGISGRPNYVWDAVNEKKSIGRYGWKANVATLKQQDAGAAVGDMGITTTLFPNENCPDGQDTCQNAIKGDMVDMSDKQLDKMIFYTSTLAPPARRDVDDLIIKRGAMLFEQAQCAA